MSTRATPRRAKLVLLVLAVALVGLGVLASEPLYWWVTTERSYCEDGGRRGWLIVDRGDDDILGAVFFDPTTG